MRIAIVNDVALAREGLRRLIRASEGHEVAWTAGTGAEAVARCAQDLPDLVLMDLIMPEMDGVQATHAIMSATPCPILIVTASVDQNTAMVFEAMGNGALDAVNTPLLAGKHADDGRRALLEKIAVIGMLTGAAPSTPSARQVAHGRQQPQGIGPCLLTIGASSGGPQALAELLAGLPQDFGGAVVIVQHVDAQFAPGLAQWLDGQCALPVRLARQGDRPAPGEVLIAGTNEHLVMLPDGVLDYSARPDDSPYRPSVDVFWHSVNLHWDGEVTAVLLTGMGRDGARGMLELRDRGAHTIAQSRDSCAVFGMPRAAIEMGAAVSVQPLADIAAAVRGEVSSPAVSVAPPGIDGGPENEF